jgi:branched-chain amino acid transport system ATP-binding protein
MPTTPEAATARSDATLLAVSGLTTGYGKQVVVRQADLTVPEGGFVAIVGPNGAGKSTLIAALAGVNRCWNGEIRWRGRPIGSASPAARVAMGMSIVLQSAPAFPGMSVAQNIQVANAIRADAGPAAVEFVYRLFPELVSRPDALARTLSGGQRQMLALGRAMSQAPGLLILDEPSFGLAVGVRHRVVSMLAEFRARTGCGVLVVEQDVQMIRDAESVYFMTAGRLDRVR